MRTTAKPRPNQVLALPTKDALYELRLTDYSGKKLISKMEIK